MAPQGAICIFNQKYIVKNTKIYIVSNCYGNPNQVYIGKTINKSRKNDHKRKYGYNAIFTILEEIEGTSKDLWKPRETYWIKQYMDLGYDVLNKQKIGGSGVECHSSESIEKIKKSKSLLPHPNLRHDIEIQSYYIIAEYKNGLGPHNLAKKYNCHTDVIKRILRENNIPFRSPSESQKCRKGEKRRKDIWDLIDEIKLLYLEGKTFTELGKIYNTSDVQIKLMLKKENVL